MARITTVKQFTKRDLSIISDLGRCRVLSLEQIKKEYWPGRKERTCAERLERLEKTGIIKKHIILGEKPGGYAKVYSLNKEGKKWATGPEGGLDRKKVFTDPGKSNEILHQVRTNEVYYRLSESERLTYKIGDVIEIERKIYKGGGGIEVPDAVYINDDGEEVYIETDCGSYTAKQVREKVRSFKGKKTIWVCPENRKSFLRKHGAEGEYFTYTIKGGRVKVG